MRTNVSIPLAINDLSDLESLSARERATRVYGLLRMILNVPVESRTACSFGNDAYDRPAPMPRVDPFNASRLLVPSFLCSCHLGSGIARRGVSSSSSS